MTERTHSTPSLTPILLLLIFIPVLAQSEDCPCTWRDDNRTWRCDVPGEAVPTQCWRVHENVKILQIQTPFDFGFHDLDHENLLNLERLEITGAKSFAPDALRTLRKLWYLDIMDGEITELPDLSSQTELTSFDVSHNYLYTVPSLSHMRKLRLASLHHNQISFLPDRFLPENNETTGMSMVHNSLRDLNASSIVYAGPQSSFTFDEQVQVVWATEEENDLLIAKNFYCNIDLEALVKIIDDPTNPRGHTAKRGSIVTKGRHEIES